MRETCSSILIGPLGLAVLLGCGSGSGGGPGDGGAFDAPREDARNAPDSDIDDSPTLPDASGGAITIDVSDVFPAGATLTDQYGGGTLTVNADGTVSVTPGPEGIALLEREPVDAPPFDWAGATIYQVMTDRYENGDPTNDGSYGRTGDGAMEVGTWHGGDLSGLSGRLDHLASLGVDALWISPIVENVHGWVGGGPTGEFKHYGYHGYWALDFTKIDQNFGTEAELQALVDGAHERGIRVVLDVVMNHPGYATGADLLAYLPEVFVDPTGNDFLAYEASATGNYHAWNDLVDYESTAWVNWWSPLFIRASFPGFEHAGSTPYTIQIFFLPDFRTESTEVADRPVLFERKADTAFVERPDFTVRDYLVEWHTAWVRRFGIDGFRCDTAEHVEPESWMALKQAGLAGLDEWKANHPAKVLDDVPFWMVAEVTAPSADPTPFYDDAGFDSVLNASFQGMALSVLTQEPNLAAGADTLDAAYGALASAIVGDPGHSMLSYVSSHDTALSFEVLGEDPVKQQQAGTALLLAPGGVTVFYGDESGRRAGPDLGDAVQAARSDMNFDSMDSSILDHFRKLSSFRKRHPAVGSGAHERLTAPAGTYAFSRTKESDKVVVVVVAPTL